MSGVVMPAKNAEFLVHAILEFRAIPLCDCTAVIALLFIAAKSMFAATYWIRMQVNNRW
jgi:hypothetical protein